MELENCARKNHYNVHIDIYYKGKNKKAIENENLLRKLHPYTHIPVLGVIFT